MWCLRPTISSGVLLAALVMHLDAAAAQGTSKAKGVPPGAAEKGVPAKAGQGAPAKGAPVAPPAGSPAAKSADTGEDRNLLCADGWPLKITYYESTSDREAPVAILLPGAEGPEKSMTRKVWASMAAVLQKRGYAVVTADLRKHGDSVDPSGRATKLGPNDYSAMAAQDMEAIKRFLVEEHQKEKLNIRKLGIAAAGTSCMVAAGFAAFDWGKKPWPDASIYALRTPKGQDVRALMMLSPNGTVKGLNSTEIMRAVADRFKGIAIQIYYNSADRTEKSAAEKLFKFVEIKAQTAREESPSRSKSKEKEKQAEEATDQSLGMDFSDARQLKEAPVSAEALLSAKDAAGKVPMEQFIPEFFDKYVKERQDPWKTRTSKLE